MWQLTGLRSINGVYAFLFKAKSYGKVVHQLTANPRRGSKPYLLAAAPFSSAEGAGTGFRRSISDDGGG
jgi:hypothetical protein